MPIHRIINEDGDPVIPPEHERYRKFLEREAQKDKKEIIEARNTQTINGPPGGPWISGHQLSERGIPGFKLFQLVSSFCLQPYDSNGEVYRPLEMPDIKHLEGKEEYPPESKKTAIEKLLSCFYQVSDLLKIPEVAVIMQPGSNLLSLEGQVSDATTGKGERQDTVVLKEESAENCFVCEGASWNISFHGKHFHLKDSKGLNYIHLLLSKPRESISASEIARMGQRDPRSIKETSGPIEERDTETFYSRMNAKKLEEDENLRKVDLNPPQARIAVKNAITDALKKIQEINLPLWKYLNQNIKTGSHCIYNPPPDSPYWKL